MYKLGIVSTSFIVDSFMEACILENRIDVTSLYSQNKFACELTDRHNIKSLYTNYEELLKSDIDIVYIASANVAHFEQASLAIKYGKHVLVEKPMCLNKNQVIELYKLAKKNNVFIMEAMTLLAFDNLDILKNLVERIGDIKHVKLNMLQQTRHYESYLKGHYFNVFDIKKGGGAFYDLGCYLVYPTLYLFGNPKEIHNFPVVNKNFVDTTVSSVFRYDGFDVSINTSKVCYDPSNSVICGDGGTIEIKGISEMSVITLYDTKGNIIEVYEKQDVPRMLPEINHFCDILDANKVESHLYTQKIAVDVITIIGEMKRENIWEY
ncbi:MAG: Gfo/Idh/MocA family protein [Mycoplasmatales bacterium]